jgi:autotransporter-associated beta strand protein
MLHGSTVSGTGSIIMSNNTSSITSRLNAGAVAVGVPVTLTADANVESPNGGNILNLNAPITGGFGLVKKGNGIVVFAAANSHTTTTIEAGTLRVGTGTGGTLGTGDVTIASTGTLSFNRDDVTAVPNTISGLGRVTMAGGNAASVELTGLNIYTGLTTVTSGTLNAPVLSNGDQPGSIGAASSDAANIVLNGGTLAHTGPATTCDRGFTLGIVGGTIAANGTGALTLDYTGGVGLVEPTPATVGNLTVGNNYQIVDPGDTNFVEIGAANNNPGTTFTATGPGTGTGTVVFANARPLRLAGTAPGIHELAATIADASNAPTSLTKNGTNTWSITATNTYTGTTRINAGILRIDGDNSAATGSITVAATGSLGGNGSSGGQVILESGGGLAVRITDWTGAPGTGYHDLAVASLDAAAVPMSVTIDTSGLSNFTDSGKSFTILNTSGGITNFAPANVTVTAPGFPGTGYWTLAQSGNALVLTYALGGNFSTWASANGISGEPATGDFDKDGLTNFVEYALGLNPTVSSVPPGTFTEGTLSFTKGIEARANGDATYEIEQSTTLGTWTVVVPNAPASPTISHTLPAGQPRQFARLRITRIP